MRKVVVSRSNKKGPYVDQKLLNKITRAKAEGKREPIKTWRRECMIPPEFVDSTLSVHNGKNFIDVYITEEMVGHRLGEFSPTRTFHGHGKITKKTLEKT